MRAMAIPVALAAGIAGPSVGAEMTFPQDDWQVASPESQSLDPEKLRAAIDLLGANSGGDGVRELAIVRNGYMVWHGDNIDHVHGVWSMTKSFTSTALGLLVDDGKCTLDTRASEFVPEMRETYPELTLRHFTTMTSGYRAVGDKTSGDYTHGPSKTPFAPSREPLFTPPGSEYAYWDSAMNQFAHVLTRIAGEPLEELFARRVAGPIGMDADQWRWGRFELEDGTVVNGGSGNSNRHIFISARQAARLGHLFLNRGNWAGRQVISPEWVDSATSAHVPPETPWAHPDSEIDGRGVYGFNWWMNGLKPNGKRKWPGVPTGTYSASGYNNNDLFVIPEWKMVVVRLGLDQSDLAITDETYAAFLRMLGEALSDD